MKKTAMLTLAGLALGMLSANAQIDTVRYLESYFETLADQQQWTSLPADNQKKWIYQKGGLDGFNPDTAYAGEKNAFYYWGDPESFSRMLVSKPINLEDASKPELSFGYAMLPDFFGLHKLALLFKAGPTAPWDTIAQYTTTTNWTLKAFNIKDYGTKYLCDGFQVAFLGTSGGGHGVCVDNVIIEEKDAITRFVKSVYASGINHDLIPSGAEDVPLMRVDVVVIGNTDEVILDSIVFTSLSDDDDVFPSAGFELVATTDSIYRPTLKGASLKIGTAVSISGGQVVFDGLAHELPTGFNSLWLVADVKASAPHKSRVDFKLASHDMKMNGTTYPAVEYSPAGYNTIEQSILYESFESATSWTLQNDFEMAVPQGYVAHITADPDYAYTGTKVLGTDLTVDGKYLLNIGEGTEYYATTPVLNLKYYDDVKLSFKKWIAFEGNDHAVIEVSIDNGNHWQTLWDSKVDAPMPDYEWTDLTFAEEFDAIASRQSWVQIRFGVIYSDGTFAYAGFNIDHFAVTGTFLTNDVGIVKINTPVDDCHNPGSDFVEVEVRNYANTQTAANLPIFFSLDGTGGLKVYDTVPGPIPVDGGLTFLFTRAAEFPGAGIYGDFTVGLEVPGDEDSDNDLATRTVFIQESIMPPHVQSFETEDGYWKIYGTQPTWMCRAPEGSIPLLPGSTKSWILSPFGNYLTSDTSYAESSCYDLTPLGRSLFEMDLWMDAEPGRDGAVIEYTVDDGGQWELLDTNVYGWDWNWYDEAVYALGTDGWTGISTGSWKTVRQVLPASLAYEPKVKFRVKWASDEDNTYRGMAFDNVRIYSAPPDIGVVSVDSFADMCEGLNPDTVRVSIRNLGLNPLYENDTVIVGYDFNGGHMATDTILLAADLLPGEEFGHTFEEVVDVDAPGLYNITAYTLIEDDPWFYLGNNDTLSWDFEVYASPTVTMLGDTVQTHLPDTVIIRPYYDADYAYYWPYDGSTDSIFHVPAAGMYDVRVTDEGGNGCVSWDSAYVELLFNDVGVDSLLFPVDHCGLGEEEYLRVILRNFGTDSIQQGDRIPVAFELNGGAAVRDTIDLTETLLAGAWVEHVFTSPVDLSAEGTYHFDIYSGFEGDTVLSNDGILKDIEIYGYPTVDLGPDLTVQALSHTLDAGPGFTSYQWSSGATTQAYEVTETGTYWVRVLDEHQCDGYDTAYIRLKIRDMSPVAFTSPLSDCSYPGPEPVVLQLWNTGTDTIPTGQLIDVAYQRDGGSWVEESHTLAADLFPGQYVEHTFPGTVDLVMNGEYAFAAAATMTGDIRTTNDTLRLTVYRYPAPVADFGLEEVEYVEDISFVIDAGYSPYHAYDWQDDSTGHSYTAVKSGTYHVVVTDTRTSCFDRDTVVLFLIYNDVGVTNTSMPAEGCSGTYEDITVRVTNLGTTNIGKDVPIYVACDVNGVQVTTEGLIRTSNFAPGTYLDLVLTGGIPVDAEGVSDIAFYTLYNEDMKGWNDTLEADFNALLSPDIDFGDVNGVLNVSLPHELDAGVGHKAYLWQDGYTGQVYTAVESGTYTVTVTGQNDCVTEKSVRINPGTGIADETAGGIGLRIYPNPSDGRFWLEVDRQYEEELTMQVIDAGGRIVYVGNLSGTGLIREEIDLGQLSRGIYQILITGKRSLYRSRMIIQ